MKTASGFDRISVKIFKIYNYIAEPLLFTLNLCLKQGYSIYYKYFDL